MQWPPEIPLEGFDFYLLLLFCFALVFQIFHFFIIHFRVGRQTELEVVAELPPVSVIICVKNEEKHLRDLVPLIMDQDYPKFELVIVNDNSWDDSEEILDALQKTYSNLKVTHLDEDKQWMQGKKFALTLGIKAAQYGRVLLTDADCRPTSKVWIKTMVGGSRKDIALGYSPYLREKNLWNAFFRFDTFFGALNYLGFALAGIPYMGVGRNLSYDKKLFFKVGGFRSHLSVFSGDDDLFINQVATKANTAVILDPASHMSSFPKENFKAWYRQKRRHMTTAPLYKRKHRIMLSSFPFTYALMWFCAILLLVLHTHPLLVIAPLLLRYLAQFIIFSHASQNLLQGDLKWKAWYLEVIWMFVMPWLILANMIRKPNAWK